MLCTFLFVLEILIIKDNGTQITKDGCLKAFSVALSLFAMISLDTINGPCFNPAIAAVQTYYQVQNLPYEPALN